MVLSPCHLWCQHQENRYNHIYITICQQLLGYLFQLVLPRKRSSTGKNKTIHTNSVRVKQFLGTSNRKRCFKLLLALNKLVSSPRIPSLPHYFLLILLWSYLYCVLNISEAQTLIFKPELKKKKKRLSLLTRFFYFCQVNFIIMKNLLASY